ncbi:hybrid sensor histidine kinase/response regulator [Leptospira yasudae]|uniref:Response regulator n=1 Tax=Leptospira yasudae TaxID=2202201 RepID=A0A6N4QQC3_9LEPT|nr:response regulator [Leptospira yasudae]TGL74501.1 response regulator [Leptospira yasudae]TGL82290.1 response regulator [Leptospira yasudae]TGL89039.1 response regulator [Leptospira yasudae]
MEIELKKKNILHKIPNDPILIVEDKQENSILLESLCDELGVKHEVASNGAEALHKIQDRKYSLFILDLMMPVMDGGSFLVKLKEIYPNAVVLVQTANDSNEKIIEIMKLGVFDYILKPIYPEIFLKVLQKALNYCYLKNMEENLAEIEGQKLRSQLEWLTYKETIRKSDGESFEKNSIYSLKTSLSQGSGIGAMTSLLDMIDSVKIPEGGYYKVDKEILDLLFANNQITKNMLSGLEKLLNLIDDNFVSETISTKDIIDKIAEIPEPLSAFLLAKRNSVNLPIFKREYKVNVNLPLLHLAMEELFLNAYKYSSSNSPIEIFTNINQGYFCITFKNRVDEKPYGGIPERFEQLVIQPFFRIYPPVESVSHLEKFGLGLGLAAVDHIVRKHHGLFFIHNANDHTSEDVSLCVLAEIFIPLV